MKFNNKQKTYFFPLVLAFMILSITNVIGQETNNPIEYLKGKWVRKVQEITPNLEDESWKDISGYVVFSPIMNGNGLRQVDYDGTNEIETYLFFDSPSNTLHGMKVDANGYLWQTEMKIDNNGNWGVVEGKAKSDKTAKESIKLSKKNASEMTFEYTVYDEKGKGLLTAKGIFIRVPKI